MGSVFYDEMVDLKELLQELALVALDDRQEEEIYHHIDQIVHHELLDEILTRLPRTEHQEFLVLFAQDPGNQELWVFLESRLPQIRTHLQKRVDGLQKTLKTIVLDALSSK